MKIDDLIKILKEIRKNCNNVDICFYRFDNKEKIEIDSVGYNIIDEVKIDSDGIEYDSEKIDENLICIYGNNLIE